FRVAAFLGAPRDAGGDTTPPRVDLAAVQSYGTIFIVGGRTEPGSEVTINGELVKVEADGSFTKPVQLTQEGWSFIEITARDAAGNQAALQRRVFVENP
ncbi:MAG: Ig-like domain-containing protein, partial [Thermoanaerobaculia bacterium]